jgi:molecular chaperone GrpE
MDNHKENKKREEAEKKEEMTVSLKESEYLKLKEEADKANECWEKMLRLQADFDNTRKRLERERQDFIKFANEGVISELLNVLDDLERTVELAQSKHQDLAAFLKGVEMILAHLYEMLKEYGVKPIGAEGKIFDPNLHEALMQSEHDDIPEHTVIEELQKGYLMNEKVIRTSKVKVSKKPANKDKAESDENDLPAYK